MIKRRRITAFFASIAFVLAALIPMGVHAAESGVEYKGEIVVAAGDEQSPISDTTTNISLPVAPDYQYPTLRVVPISGPDPTLKIVPMSEPDDPDDQTNPEEGEDAEKLQYTFEWYRGEINRGEQIPGAEDDSYQVTAGDLQQDTEGADAREKGDNVQPAAGKYDFYCKIIGSSGTAGPGSAGSTQSIQFTIIVEAASSGSPGGNEDEESKNPETSSPTDSEKPDETETPEPTVPGVETDLTVTETEGNTAYLSLSAGTEKGGSFTVQNAANTDSAIEVNPPTDKISSSVAGGTATVTIGADTPVGVYLITVPQQEGSESVVVPVAVQGTVSISEAPSTERANSISVNAGSPLTLSATLGTVPAIPTNYDVLWRWSVKAPAETSGDVIKAGEATSQSGSATFEASKAGEYTISVEPVLVGKGEDDSVPSERAGTETDPYAGIALAPAQTQTVKVEDAQTPTSPPVTAGGIALGSNYTDAADPTTVKTLGLQTPLTASGSGLSDTGWSYSWKIEKAEGASNTGTAPALAPSTTSAPVTYFVPAAANAGTWAVTCTASSTTEAGTTVQIKGNITVTASAVLPGYSTWSPIDTAQNAVPGTNVTFSLTPTPGTTADGKTDAGSVYWVRTPLASGTSGATALSPSTTWQTAMPESGNLTVTAYVVPQSALTNASDEPVTVTADWLTKNGSGYTQQSWTVRPVNGQPTITGVNITPYDGTSTVISSVPTAQLAVGGYAVLEVQLSSANDPSLCTYQWQVSTNNGTTWASAPGFAGTTGQRFVTPVMTPSMDGWQYKVIVSCKTAASTLTAESSPVALAVNTNQLQPVVSITRTTPRLDTAESPAVVHVADGGLVELEASVSAPYGLTPSIQWERAEALSDGSTTYNWQKIDGATSRTCSLTEVTSADNGDVFRCTASVNYGGGLTGVSDPVTLAVEDDPDWVTITAIIIEGEEEPLYVLEPNAQAELACLASSSTRNLEYQWYMSEGSLTDGYMITDANAFTYTLSDLASGIYGIWCEVTNPAASPPITAQSNIIEVVVPSTDPKVQITSQPPSTINTPANSNAAIAVRAYTESGNALTYRWERYDTSSASWTTLANATGAQLTLASVNVSASGSQYRCVVTNAVTGDSATSDTCTLYVFPAASYATITTPPASQNLTTPLREGTCLQAVVRVPSGQSLSRYAYQWEYAAEQDAAYQPVAGAAGTLDQFPVTVSGSQYSVTVPYQLVVSDGSDSAPGRAAEPVRSGFYRIRLTNTGVGDTIHPETTSSAAQVRILTPGEPFITSQPADQTATVGSSATFTVGAGVLPTNNRIAYRWQKWVAGPAPAGTDTTVPSASAPAGYWANCDSSDGTGTESAAFTTIPATSEMQAAKILGKPIYYRCVVLGQQSGLSAVSKAAGLTVTKAPPTVPVLEGTPESGLTVSGTGDTRYLRGITAAKNGTPVQTVLDGLVSFRNCTMEIRRGGTTLAATAIVATGDTVVLLGASGETLDQATVVVRGDVLGQGVMNLSQLVRMASAYRGEVVLTGAYLLAGQVTGNHTSDRLTLSDLVAEATLYRNAMGA